VRARFSPVGMACSCGGSSARKNEGACLTHAPHQALACPPRNVFRHALAGAPSTPSLDEIASFDVDSSRSYAKCILVMRFLLVLSFSSPASASICVHPRLPAGPHCSAAGVATASVVLGRGCSRGGTGASQKWRYSRRTPRRSEAATTDGVFCAFLRLTAGSGGGVAEQVGGVEHRYDGMPWYLAVAPASYQP